MSLKLFPEIMKLSETDEWKDAALEWKLARAQRAGARTMLLMSDNWETES